MSGIHMSPITATAPVPSAAVVRPAEPEGGQTRVSGSGCSSCGSSSCPGCDSKSVNKAQGANQLTEEEQRQVEKLKARDREVRAHEQAHKAVGGQYAGGISYEFQQGPDGKRYAVGGEVSIDASPIEGDPAATIEKMRIVKAAALAPAEPSAQDRKVAAMADAKMAQARAELAQQSDETDPNDPEAGKDNKLRPSLNQQLAELRGEEPEEARSTVNPEGSRAYQAITELAASIAA